MRSRSRPRPASGRCCRPGVAELIAPGRYRLSRLLRGQRGTEGAIGSPAPAGARVVVLDEALAPLPVPEAALGLEANWRFGPASKPVADRSYRQLGFTPEGVGLRPFSVAHVRQPWRTAREPGDLVIAWTRRSRALAADSWTAAEVPLAEEREAYEVEVLDGATVVRTLATTTTSVTYTAAQQLADFGALLGPGDTLADPHLPALRPRRAGRAGLRHPRVLIPMPDTSTHLLLPYLLAAQAQKHVTVNEALRLLDGLVQLAVLDRHLTAPPASPADGARYIVASGATGAWAGWDLNVAYRVDGAWMRLVPRPGWQAWVVDEASFLAWDGSAWNAAGLPAFFSDAVFQLAHDADPTRRAVFDLAAIAAGATRTFALPDVSTELAGLSGAQTFDGDKTFAGELEASGPVATIGTASGTATYGLGTGATASGATKTVNLGTGGAAGSDTVVNIGSDTPGADGATVVNTPTVTFANGVTVVGMPQANLTALLLGLGGAVADAWNRLSVNTPAVLLNNAGAGIEATVNKAAAGNDAAFAFKTGFSARALIGLLGSDDFSFKVSPDGSAYHDAILIDRTSGRVELPKPAILPAASSAPAAPASGKLALYARTPRRPALARRHAAERARLLAAAASRAGAHRELAAVLGRHRSPPRACRTPRSAPSRRRASRRPRSPPACAAGG